MLRILSILVVIAGLLAAGIGGAALLERMEAPKSANAASAPAAEEASSVAIASAEPEVAAAPASEAAPAPADSAIVAGEATTSPDDETNFNFQAQMEENPVGLSAAPEQGVLAETASAMSPPPAPSFEDTLKTVPVAHETPRTAEYKRAFDVTFALDATGDVTAADALPGNGVIEESEAKVSDRVEVRLSGASFNIAAASPPVQALSTLTENTWRWSVTPLSAGEHDLVFEVFAVDSDAVTPLRTYQDSVTVKVSGLNRAVAFADQANPLFVLLGGLGSALAGLFAAVKFFGKK